MERDAAKRNLWLMSVLAFLSSFRAYEGVLAVYFVSITGSYALAMTVLSTMHFSASFFEVPTGVFSDYIGRRMTMIVYYGSAAIVAYVHFFAYSLSTLLLASVIMGFAMAMRTGATSAYVYENLEVLGRVEDFKAQEGGRQAIGRWSLVTSAILGTVLIYFFDIRTAVFMTSVVLTVGFIVSFWLTDVSVHDGGSSNMYANLREAWRTFWSDGTLRDLSIGRIIMVGAGNVEYRFRALLFSTVMADWVVNFLGMLSNVATGITMKYSQVLVKRFGIFRTMLYSELFDRLMTATLTVIHTATSLFSMNILSSLVFGAREIAAEDLLQERYLKEQRATMGSIVGLGGSLVYATLGIAIGALADQIGLIYTMLLMQVVMGSALIFFYRGISSRAA